MRQMKLVFILALIVGTTSATRTQSPAQVGNALLTHVGIVVRDIDETIRQYVNVMGFPAPERELRPFGIDVPIHTVLALVPTRGERVDWARDGRSICGPL